MQIDIKRIRRKFLEKLRLSPLSLAEKCRIAFGAAVIFILAIALLLPYVWMGRLTKKASLDAGRARSEILFRNHFRLPAPGGSELCALDDTGAALSEDKARMKWIPLKRQEDWLERLGEDHRKTVRFLMDSETRSDSMTLQRKYGVLYSDYVRLFRANDNCLSCHNQQGSATTFAGNEPVGVVLIRQPAAEMSRTSLMNKVWIIIAGLIGGIGAIIAFYIITQRVILRPIRQLRALANNVAEGNLDIRSAIKTRDEYEKLANAFNNMLDGLQETQQKLRQANKQLDAKIAELSERNIELFKASKVKSEFLANMSHEFRTPLNAILGFAEILRQKSSFPDRKKRKKYAENIITSGKMLLNMINDLLDLAKTEAGKMELHLEKTSVPELCDTIVRSFALLTKQKKIKVKMNIEDKIPTLYTDVGKVFQILSNFVSNAVKFTAEHGRVEIIAAMLDEKTVRLSVTDTGCGIAEADKEKIFGKFQQADGSITRLSTGSGLGLAISKELAVLLAGDVGMQSSLGEGSKFWLDIPVTLTGDGGGKG